MLHYWQVLQSEVLQHRDASMLGAIVLIAIFFALWASASRKRYVLLQHSSATELLALQLGRIADALEHLGARNFSVPLASEEVSAAGADALRAPGVGSMLGFGRAGLPNPLYRPR